MNYRFRHHLTVLITIITVLALTACQMTPSPAPAQEATPMPNAAPVATMTAGALRAALDQLLGEHVLLAASATNAALNGRDAIGWHPSARPRTL